MISIGGIPDQPATNWSDPWRGMQILDMTNLIWTESYDSRAAAYQPPVSVTEYYKTNNLFPESWGDPKLAEIFGNTTATGTPAPSSHRTNVGAIAGGVVGGVVVLVALGVAIFWWAKRRRSQQYAPASTTATAELTEQEIERKEMPGDGHLVELPVYEQPQEMQFHEVSGQDANSEDLHP
jgi:nitrogen fixation-related uncharacterized protein